MFLVKSFSWPHQSWHFCPYKLCPPDPGGWVLGLLPPAECWGDDLTDTGLDFVAPHSSVNLYPYYLHYFSHFSAQKFLEMVRGVICWCFLFFSNYVHMFTYRQIWACLSNTILQKFCSFSSFRLIIFSHACSQWLCGAFMLTTTLSFNVSAAWHRPDHERQGGCGKGPASITGHSSTSSSPSELQTTLREQRTPGKPFNGQQRLRRSGGRVPLQEMRQVSHHRCHISQRCCDGDVGMGPLTYAELTASLARVT